MGAAGRSGLSDTGILPGRRDLRVVRVFAWYARRLVAKRFAAMRITPDGRAALASLDAHDAPVIVAATHASWWDPLALLLLGRRYMPSRAGSGPMDAAQLRRFAIFRRIGVFGVDPDDPASLPAMVGHVQALFAAEERPLLLITPQGRFADPREPVRVRPGAAAIAAAHPGCRVATVALEYPFWQDQRPELLVHAAECAPLRRTTAGWQRAIQEGLQAQANALAALSIARDPGAFETIVGDGAARIHPVYDLWLRLTGRGGAIEGRRAEGASRRAVAGGDDRRGRESGEP